MLNFTFSALKRKKFLLVRDMHLVAFVFVYNQAKTFPEKGRDIIASKVD